MMSHAWKWQKAFSMDASIRRIDYDYLVQIALEGQDCPRTYLAHHDLGSVIISSQTAPFDKDKANPCKNNRSLSQNQSS